MNQAITGNFISEVRKKKGFTQKQLAEKLNISDKTISKWETGNGFPEISLMIPLCKTLEISVNELLTGEYITDTQYKEKAEANMVDMIKEKQENAKKMKMTVISGLSTTISSLTIVMVLDFYEKYMPLNVKIILFAIAFITFAMGIYVVADGDRTIGYYHCKECDEYFIPTTGSYIMGMHTITKRYLRCPKCKKLHWCKKVLSKNNQDK